jgi:hypothetical protein
MTTPSLPDLPPTCIGSFTWSRRAMTWIRTSMGSHHPGCSAERTQPFHSHQHLC